MRRGVGIMGVAGLSILIAALDPAWAIGLAGMTYALIGLVEWRVDFWANRGRARLGAGGSDRTQ